MTETDISALIKSAMFSCAEGFAAEIADSLGFDMGRELTPSEYTQVADAVSRLLDTPDHLEAERQRAESINQQYLRVVSERDDVTDELEELKDELAALKAKLANPVLPRVAAVYADLSVQARHRTSPENVRDVLDALCSAGFTVKGE